MINTRVQEKSSPKEDEIADFKVNAGRLVAAVMTQTFHFMVECGTQYGYITTGEAYVFLYIKPEDNAKTVFYHLAEPKEDVNAQKKAYPNTEDYLHRTAISQLLASSLLALASVQEIPDWRDAVTRTLKTWRVDYESILQEMRGTPEPQDILSPLLSSSSPQTYSLDIPDRSPIHNRLRPRKVTDSSSNEGQRRVFCTQLCLQGLDRGGPLDRHCPNMLNHCREGPNQGDRHQIKGEEFWMLLSKQLQRSRGDACQPLGIQGSRGALFKVALTSHGYTVVGKGTVQAFVKHPRHEAGVYRRLTTVRGVHILIWLGSIDLDQQPYYYQAGIRIVHLMLLSWAGECLYNYDGSKNKICVGCTDWPKWTSSLIHAVL